MRDLITVFLRFLLVAEQKIQVWNSDSVPSTPFPSELTHFFYFKFSKYKTQPVEGT